MIMINKMLFTKVRYASVTLPEHKPDVIYALATLPEHKPDVIYASVTLPEHKPDMRYASVTLPEHKPDMRYASVTLPEHKPDMRYASVTLPEHKRDVKYASVTLPEHKRFFGKVVFTELCLPIFFYMFLIFSLKSFTMNETRFSQGRPVLRLRQVVYIPLTGSGFIRNFAFMKKINHLV